jgi:glucosamine-phosphate N-acetyltransferase
MEFRNLQKTDYNKNYLNLLKQLTKVDKQKITFEKFENFINKLNKNHKIIVIEFKNKIVATGTVLIENKIIHGLRKVAHIEDIVVDKESRGMGLGKKIISFLIDIAEKENCYKVILNCRKENINFYEKCGLKNHAIQMVKYFN